ncbi:MAG TPA: dihydroorotate dehydrogenase (quinone), partial [Cyclobacteriaceae bacterium]|nr:dihydroorotate dehydrogenase (quinone) [Cyclobacteriaceae bacterium]
MYKSFLRPILFLFAPESIHHFTFSFLRIIGKIPGVQAVLRSVFEIKHPQLSKTILGISFPNPVGLAAGFDKDAKLIDEL